jgi:hypothetical protein
MRKIMRSWPKTKVITQLIPKGLIRPEFEAFGSFIGQETVVGTTANRRWFKDG